MAMFFSMYGQVFAWDQGKGSYDTDYSDGRSYISAISEEKISGSCANSDMGEARMDIENSEMGYLGYYAAEAYGLVWKVRASYLVVVPFSRLRHPLAVAPCLMTSCIVSSSCAARLGRGCTIRALHPGSCLTRAFWTIEPVTAVRYVRPWPSSSGLTSSPRFRFSKYLAS